MTKSNLRPYKPKQEKDRVENLSKVEIKNFHYYNKMDSLWNEPDRLSPSLARYSDKNIDPQKTFKKTVKDLAKIA